MTLSFRLAWVPSGRGLATRVLNGSGNLRPASAWSFVRRQARELGMARGGSGVSVPSGFGIGSGGAFSVSLAVPKVPISVRPVVLRIPRLSEGFLASVGPETLSVPPALRLSHHLRFARFPKVSLQISCVFSDAAAGIAAVSQV